MIVSPPLRLLTRAPLQTHGVLLQYLDFLTSPTAIPPEDYAEKVLPPLRDLHELYGISAPICMQIIRPTLHLALLVGAFSIVSVSNLTMKAEPCNRDRREGATGYR